MSTEALETSNLRNCCRFLLVWRFLSAKLTLLFEAADEHRYLAATTRFVSRAKIVTWRLQLALFLDAVGENRYLEAANTLKYAHGNRYPEATIHSVS